MENWVTIEEAAHAYRVSGQHIRNLIRRGIIPAVRLSPHVTRIDIGVLKASMRRVEADKKARQEK